MMMRSLLPGRSICARNWQRVAAFAVGEGEFGRGIAQDEVDRAGRQPGIDRHGGQTGADQGGLLAARELGIPTNGTAPRDWLTEDGPREALLRSFGLKECRERGYPARTKANVLNADGTLIVGPHRTGGSALTGNRSPRPAAARARH